MNLIQNIVTRRIRWPLVLVAVATVAFADQPASPVQPSLTDPAFVWLADAPPVVLTGRIAPLPPTKNPITISASLVELAGARQRTLTAPLAEDGTFRLEIPGGVPLQQLWLSVKPVYYGQILLRRGLHIEFDAKAMGGPKKYAGKGVTFSGPDGSLNDAANRFILHERERQLALGEEARAVAREAKRGFEGGLARLVELRDELLAMLERFDAGEHRAFLADQIMKDHLCYCVRLAERSGEPLERTRLLPVLQRLRIAGATNETNGLLKALGFLLWRPVVGQTTVQYSLSELLPWIEIRLAQPQHVAKAAEFLPLIAATRQRLAAGEKGAAVDADLHQRLNAAGLIDGRWMMFERLDRQVAQVLSPELADLVRIAALPEEANLRAEFTQRLFASVGERWGARYLREVQAESAREQQRIAATLAQAIVATQRTAATDTPIPVATLPDIGATLYALPGVEPAALLARLRELHPGKALLLDLWGSWCPPCVAELPASKLAKSALAEAQVAFVYLGARMDDNQWKQAIAQYTLAGTHVLLDQAQAEGLMQLLGGSGYPTYALFDAAGQRINAPVREWLKREPTQIAKAIAGPLAATPSAVKGNQSFPTQLRDN